MGSIFRQALGLLWSMGFRVCSNYGHCQFLSPQRDHAGTDWTHRHSHTPFTQIHTQTQHVHPHTLPPTDTCTHRHTLNRASPKPQFRGRVQVTAALCNLVLVSSWENRTGQQGGDTQLRVGATSGIRSPDPRVTLRAEGNVCQRSTGQVSRPCHLSWVMGTHPAPWVWPEEPRRGGEDN